MMGNLRTNESTRRRGLPVALVALLALSTGAGACAKKGTQEETSGKQTYTLTKKAYLHIKDVQEAMEKKDWAAALHELGRMKEREFLNPYERATMWGMYAMVYSAQNDYKQAMSSLEEANKLSDAIPDEEAMNLQYNLAQLYLVNDRFKESADTFSAWLKKAKNPQAEAYYITASAYAQAKQFKTALPYVTKAVEMRGDKVEEAWLQLLMSVSYELRDNAAVAELLKRLIKTYPKKSYWMQLSQTYLVLEQPEKALATLELAYAQDMLTEETELLTLARLQMQERIPLKAAALIEKHMNAAEADPERQCAGNEDPAACQAELSKLGKISRSPENLELLAKAWLLAQERDKAEAVLSKAAEVTETGEMHLYLGRILVETQQWTKAKAALTKALKKGGLKSEGEAHLLMGIAHFNSEKRGPAMTSFNEAKKDPATATAAEKWIGHLTNGGGDDPASEGDDGCASDDCVSAAPGSTLEAGASAEGTKKAN